MSSQPGLLDNLTHTKNTGINQEALHELPGNNFVTILEYDWEKVNYSAPQLLDQQAKMNT